MAKSLSASLTLCVTCLAVTACGPRSDLADAGSRGGDAGPPASWGRCSWAARYRVEATDTDAGRCPTTPAVGELVTLETRDEATGWLNIGGQRLLVHVDAECRLEGEGCSNTEDAGVWLSARVTGSLEGEGQGAPVLRLESERIENHRAAACPASALFQLKPVDADCDPEGPWVMATAPALVSGECNTKWSNEVTMLRRDGGYSASVGGQDFGLMSKTLGACSWSKTKGRLLDGGSADYWLWNGALRRTSVTITTTADELHGTIDDALAADTQAAHCPGGRFSFSANRPSRVRTELGDTCAPRPFVRGNGACDADAGETCFDVDCACAQGLTCVAGAPPTCRQPCDAFAEDCPAGQRCGASHDQRGYCTSAGAGSDGGSCGADSECAAGYMCLLGRTVPATDAGFCAPKCAYRQRACAAGFSCILSRGGATAFGGCIQTCGASGQCSGSSTCRITRTEGTYTAVGACLPIAGPITYGGACAASCPAGQMCSTQTVPTTSLNMCVPECQSSMECPAELPRCSLGACAFD